MIYVSIDIETSGLNPDRHQILSIGAIIEDTTKKLDFDDIPKFYCLIAHDEIIGQPYALNMNKDIIDIISKNNDVSNVKIYKEDDVAAAFFNFLMDNLNTKNTLTGGQICINVAGKNFGTFDKLFLQKLPNWNRFISIRQRILDPAILCVSWNLDESLPNLALCKERCNIDGIVTHNALEDALDVIRILRKNY